MAACSALPRCSALARLWEGRFPPARRSWPPVLLLGAAVILPACQRKEPGALPRPEPSASIRRPAVAGTTPAPNRAAGAALTALKPRAVEFERGSPSVPEVALTFDAGAYARGVPLILKTLAERHLRCTFFLTGEFCKDYPAQARAIADAGMELGNHSYSHPHFPHLADAAIRSQLKQAEETITRTCGRSARPLFRFPYGESTRHDRDVVAAAGYQPVNWTIDSLDSVGKPKSAGFISSRLLHTVKPGYVTLMHVSYKSSAEALPAILDRLEQQGIRVVPVSELLLQKRQRIKPGGRIEA